jgi:prefoldin subunit 5
MSDPKPELKLELTPRKLNRHVVIAINHLRQRRDGLEAQIEKMKAELDEVDAAIEALG